MAKVKQGHAVVELDHPRIRLLNAGTGEDLRVELYGSEVTLPDTMRLVAEVSANFVGALAHLPKTHPIRNTHRQVHDLVCETIERNYKITKEAGTFEEKMLLPITKEEQVRVEHQLTQFIGQVNRALAERQKTFAMPSHPMMFTLLAMFSGKPERIPRKLLTKPHGERTEEEQKEANKFLHSIIGTNTKTNYESDGSKIVEETKTYLVSDNPKVQAKAEAVYGSMFSDDPAYSEEAQALYIKRTFGAEGMRHLLGLIIGLDENGRQGDFEWNINDHLGRLGYKKQDRGAFPPEAKKTATAIIKVFTSLLITTFRKDGKNEKLEGQKLFSVDGFKIEKYDQEIINETLTLHATSFWYRNAFEQNDGKSPQYTKLLKKISQENHREHPLTIYLAPLLAIFWRMQLEEKMSLKNLMDWCDLDYKDSRKFKKNVRDLEAELNYMVEHGYMGTWKNSEETLLPSACSKPLDCILTLKAPTWLENEVQLIHDKRDSFLLPTKKALSKDEFNNILKASNMSCRQLGNHLGISGQAVSNYATGKRKISPAISEKIRGKFPDLV